MSADTDWYVYRDQNRWGPYTWQQLLEMAQNGNIIPNDHLWHSQYPNFVDAGQVQGLFESITPNSSAALSSSQSMNQIQCPNCGGFQTIRPRDQWEERNKPAGLGASAVGVFIIIMLLFIFPFGTIIALYMIFHRNPKEPAPSPDTFKCLLCGYQWVQKPGEVLPINIRPDLIQQGEKRLRELSEERKLQAQRQRDAEGAFWLSQQQKK